MVKNDLISNVDSLGLEQWKIDESACTVEMTWNVNLRFFSDYNDWTPARMQKFRRLFVEGIESDWNANKIVLKPSSKEGCCKCANGFSPRLKINLVDSSADWSPKVRPYRGRVLDAHVTLINEDDVDPPMSGGHRVVSHEFGHSIGLTHPGEPSNWKPWQWGRDQYNYVGTDNYGRSRNGPNEVMGTGGEFSDFYFERWKEALNKEHPGCSYDFSSK